MKKHILSTALIGALFSFHMATAQVAAKKGVTLDEVYKRLNELSSKGDDASKAELEKEAKALNVSKDEDFVGLSGRIYEFLEQKEKAEEIDKSILKRFPKGKKARYEAYNKIFEGEDIQASEAEKQYNNWVKKFPQKSFGEKDREIYSQAESKLASLFLKEGNAAKANEYIDKLKASPSFATYAGSIASELTKANNYTAALPLLEQTYNQTLEATKSSDNQVKNKASRTYSSLAPSYAKALAETGNIQKSTDVIKELLESSPYAGSSATTISLLSSNYEKQGKDLDAFLALEKFTIKNGKNADVIKQIEPLYHKLNNQKGDFNAYISDMDTQIKDALVSKYKGEMIKKEAPNFSLVDMQGKTVSLADLKGKVVVLDFWATWCGPCKISFPGMQAAVNKYKDDNEVEFLFIDTWQREENYKEVVSEFIAKNKYTFHVLFDEMKDRSKATTSSYGVNGIPHKVVIDKEGFIRFESSGGNADVEKVVNEIETKIELARKG